MDFVAMPYLHHNPDGVGFADGSGEELARLVSYVLSTDRLIPGDALTVHIDWDNKLGMEESEAALRLVSPAEHPDNGISSYTLAQDVVPLAGTTVHHLTLPENIPRGLYLLQLGLIGPDQEWSAQTPSGADRGPLYLRPVRVTEGAPVLPDAPVLALVGPDIRLHAAHVERGADPAEMTVHLEWSTVRRLASNYGISVRLLDADGKLRVAKDTQPGYGFSPTSLWRPGERVADRYVLTLPDDLPPGGGYRALFVFYQVSSTAEIARVELGPFALPLESPVVFEPPSRVFELPVLPRPLDVNFTDPADPIEGDQIQLAGYDLEQEADRVDLMLWWVAERSPHTDYTVFVHLFDPAAEAVIVTQSDAMPRQGSYPTSGWLAGEVVSDTKRLSLTGVPPGVYRLAIGLYDVTTGDRLEITASEGMSFSDRRLILPAEVILLNE
jgi:hypothetical protein